MTTTNANGIIFLEESDNISPFHTLINTLQQGTSDALDSVKAGPAIKVIRTVGQNTSSGSWNLIAGWSSTEYSQGGFTVSGASVVIPTTGVYSLDADCSWSANATGRRGLSFSIDATTTPSREQDLRPAGVRSIIHTQVSAKMKLTAGQRVSILLYQDAGATLASSSCVLAVTRVA